MGVAGYNIRCRKPMPPLKGEGDREAVERCAPGANAAGWLFSEKQCLQCRGFLNLLSKQLILGVVPGILCMGEPMVGKKNALRDVSVMIFRSCARFSSYLLQYKLVLCAVSLRWPLDDIGHHKAIHLKSDRRPI